MSDDWASLHAAFHWHVPGDFSLAAACCGRWARATPERVAIRYEHEDGRATTHTYRALQDEANRLANVLRRWGIARGDRVAIVMPQRFETAVAHIAIAQLGAVAVPLSMLFGAEALEYRLNDSAAKVGLVDESGITNLRAARPACHALATVIAVGAAEGQGDIDWRTACAAEPSDFEPVPTSADDPAVLIYTSGTTGPPKGALIPQRAIVGNLPGFVVSQNGFGLAPEAWAAAPAGALLGLGLGPGLAGEAAVALAPGAAPTLDQGAPSKVEPAALPNAEPAAGPTTRVALAPTTVFWSPADWAWTGGLMDALLPTLFFGRTIVAYQGRFTPETAFELLERHRVTHAFLFPTALKAMMKAVPAPRERYRFVLEGLMSAGEAVGDAVFAWCRDALGVPVNEMFGQTEMNYIVGNSHRRWPARPGSMGRAYPGHRIAVLDESGTECPRGRPGDVALHRLDVHGDPDPIFFLGYWRNDTATRAKYTGDPAASWCRTGDTAVMDDDGYLWYQGRSDDVFKAAGYRIGPSEIENCLVKHPAVANAAVVPKPDAERGALVKAYVVLVAGVIGTPALVAELQQHVRGRLAPYEYPKEIEFIGALPMTTTGKVQRRVLRLQEEARARAADR